jgi:uncharacterized repeat protein (TIGR01451 family)
MSYKIRRSLYQVTIKLMLISLIASTLAGLIPSPLLHTLAPGPLEQLVKYVEALLPKQAVALAAGNITGTAPNLAIDGGVGGVTVTAATPRADLELVKTVDKTNASTGDLVTYTLTLTNHGPVMAIGVRVKDSLPGGVTYQSLNPQQGTYAANTGLWNVGTVATNISVILTITVKI